MTSRSRPRVVDGFTSPVVSALSGVPPSTLSNWVQNELVTPSLRPSSGKRATRWWSVSDLVTVRALRALRDAGCPMQTLRRARATIEGAWRSPLSSVVLCWDGTDVLIVDQWGNVRSAIKHPGQQVLHFVVIPMEAWRLEAQAEASAVEVSYLRRLRAGDRRRSLRPATPVAPLRPGSSA